MKRIQIQLFDDFDVCSPSLTEETNSAKRQATKFSLMVRGLINMLKILCSIGISIINKKNISTNRRNLIGTLTSPSSLPTLPFDLIIEILSRLPVKQLLQLRCVCKSWKSLISDPKFAKKHLALVRLWNPSIRKFKELPRVRKPQSYQLGMRGFGYDPISDNYKVVVVLLPSDNVYTLGTNFWKNIEEFPFGCVAVQQRSGTFVSGTINWLVSRMYPTRRQHFIASFDLRNESYQEVFLPDCRVVDVYNLRLGALGVLRDCLCLVFRNDVWVMKEYGNHESWTKLFAITYMQDLPISYDNIKVLNIFGDNQVLLKSTEWTDKLIVYNFKNGTYKYTKFGNSAEVCGESLISSCF
ncbi:F-box/kelch-repeat protein At3g23880-like [Trifolium pratense]|uniref:F-box/kelch-repeat protein At3g23880-like n=1 Tax=Trifolium pratense TaxID=57577 RepID=UPI001E6952EB|nr:F-box/kelch-repeat protein At3g23880-like [Trifolium pratense]